VLTFWQCGDREQICTTSFKLGRERLRWGHPDACVFHRLISSFDDLGRLLGVVGIHARSALPQTQVLCILPRMYRFLNIVLSHIWIGNRNQQVNICDNLDNNLSVLVGRIRIRYSGSLTPWRTTTAKDQHTLSLVQHKVKLASKDKPKRRDARSLCHLSVSGKSFEWTYVRGTENEHNLQYAANVITRFRET
jgi:hypothetical protein